MPDRRCGDRWVRKVGMDGFRCDSQTNRELLQAHQLRLKDGIARRTTERLRTSGENLGNFLMGTSPDLEPL